MMRLNRPAAGIVVECGAKLGRNARLEPVVQCIEVMITDREGPRHVGSYLCLSVGKALRVLRKRRRDGKGHLHRGPRLGEHCPIATGDRLSTSDSRMASRIEIANELVRRPDRFV